jgi:fructosamine-3-kinase
MQPSSELDFALTQLGFGTPVQANAQTGGMVSRVNRLTNQLGQTLIVKELEQGPAHLYALEVIGLQRMQGVPGWRIPQVRYVSSRYLLLEDLGPQGEWNKLPAPHGHAFWEVLGRGLAHLHGRLSNRFGWEGPSYWGLLPVDNSWDADGHRFYAKRFRAMASLPNVLIRVPGSDLDRVHRVADRIMDLFPRQPPSLLHGDLWAGNRGLAPDGAPAIFDPFIHYGWPEWDLHGAVLFGGFSDRWIDAYRECHAMEAGWRTRAELLGVMHLLAMVELADATWAIPWASRILTQAVG